MRLENATPDNAKQIEIKQVKNFAMDQLRDIALSLMRVARGGETHKTS